MSAHHIQRYFVHLSYQGTNYHGWQRQKVTDQTVQEILESQFSKLFKKPTTLIGCGRTDTGVHASQYFMHFDHAGVIDYDLVFRLNKSLPPDIRVLELIPVDDSSHAQFDAQIRTYQYWMHFDHNPFLTNLSFYVDKKSIDFERLIQVIEFFRQQSDFRSMCKKPNQYKSTICRIDEFELKVYERRMLIQVSANRFLQSMVRLLVGRSLDVAQGCLSFSDLTDCFKKNEAPRFPVPAKPHGLYLSKVIYPKLSRDNNQLPFR